MNEFDNIPSQDMIKKEARGIDGADLGEIQEISSDYIVTKRGTVDRDRFLIPKHLVESFDGNTVKFNVMAEDINKYKG